MIIRTSLAILLTTQFLFVALHDLIDIPGWIHGKQIRAVIGKQKFWIATLINAIFPGLAVVFALFFWHRMAIPTGIRTYWVIYCAITLSSAIGIWYVPYFFGCDQARKQQYADLYAGTRQILPPRGDNPRPNAFHILMHLLFVVNMLLVLVLRFST